MSPVVNFRGHLLTFIAAVGVAGAFFLYFLSIGGGLRLGGGTYEVRAVLPTAANLAPQARVTMAGLDVGQVAKVQRRGDGALVTLMLTNHDVTPLPRDSVIRLRARTAVGENYVSIDRGHAPQMLAGGAVLPITQPANYVDVDQVLSIFQGRKREHARQLLQGLGEGLQGRGAALNSVLRGASDTTDGGAKLVDVLGNNRTQVSRLVDQFGSLAATIGERGADIHTIARDGLVSVRSLASRDAALRALLTRLPSTLAEVRATTRTLQPVTRTAAPVLSNLAVALREVRPAVRTLRPAAQEGRRIIGELKGAAPELTGTLAALRQTAAPAAAALPQLVRTICQAGPLVSYLHPYTPDVIQTLAGLGSAANSYDAIGHLIRLSAVVDENTLVGLPADVSTATYKLLRTGLLSKALGPLNWNPYPPPGSVGKTTAQDKVISGPAELATSGFKYPRIQAAC